METHSPTADSGRRRFLSRVITAIHTLIGGTLGVILGGSVVSPGLAQREEKWLPAGSLGALPQNEPTPVMLRVARQDGYTQIVERRAVFLVRTGEASVVVLDSTCTHLGCRVSWDADARQLRCPCHGGVYDRTGEVVSGPPPQALAKLPARIDGDRILVQV